MYDTFENLNGEKKSRIVKAAVEEFAIRGYEKASIDSIVAKAGISKGSIFQYFGSKQNLYMYLCDHQYNMIVKSVEDGRNPTEKDFFEIYRNAIRVRVRILKESPYINGFFLSAMRSERELIKDWVHGKYLGKEELEKSLVGDFDRSPFRENLDVELAISSFRYAIDGLSAKWMDLLKSGNDDITIEIAVAEFDRVINFYRELYYRVG